MPLRHKETNTNRFLPFAERLDNISVDVIHRIGHRYEEQNEDDVESYFAAAITKWNDLNCSQGWVEFQSEVKDVQSLAQVILLKDRLAATLIKHLQKKDPLTVQTLLEIVVALARDLRQDFYPFYPDFLSTIVSYLNCKEAEILEWSFHCLAYLFKFLWRCMVRNIEPVLNSLLPLLSSKRQKYINYFAADSFAFLARKVKDQAAFISLLLNHLKEEPKDAEGCGRLVFAWLRGVKGQLHSCAQDVLLILVQSLGNESLPFDVLLSLISETISHLVVEIRPGGLTFLWEALKTSLKNFHTNFVSGKVKSCDPALGALKLLHQFCVHCDAVHVAKPIEVVDVLLHIYGSTKPLPDEILSELSSITAILLMSPTIRLPQDRTVKLSSKVLAMSPPKIILGFVKEMLSWSAMDTLILPRLLEIVANGLISDNDGGLGLQILAQLVQFKVPSMCNGRDEQNMLQLNLDFSTAACSISCSSDEISTKLLTILDISDEHDGLNFSKTFQERIYALRVLPHIKHLKELEAITTLQRLLTFLCKEIKNMSLVAQLNSDVSTAKLAEQEKRMSQLLFMLFASLEAAIHIQGEKKELNSLLKLELLLETLLPPNGTGHYRLSTLRIINLYLSSVDLQNRKDAKKVSLSIYESLKNNLAAPHHLVREMTCRILCLLPLASEIHSMFCIFLDAERISATVTDYRDKFQLLQKISFDTTQSIFVKHADFGSAPLLFLLGSFYVNFQLLWDPLKALVSSFATGMTTDEFWPIFHTQLSLAAEQRDFSPLDGTDPEIKFDCTLLDDYYSSITSVDDKPDYAHYRLLLYQACHNFHEVCEKKNRDLSTLFLSFIEQEFYSSNAEVAKSWDIKKREDASAALIDDDDDDDDDDDEDDDDVDEEGDDKNNTEIENEERMDVGDESETKPRALKASKFEKSEEKPSARLRTKTLLAYLQLFSKFRNPRTIFREPEINQVYQDLLSHKHPEVQKAALECVLTYKHKYLVPYTENLFALIDNKSFKNEVTKFKIDKDSGVIQEEHRTQLIPILMRLVYSKMTAKAGMRSGGKAGPGVRRALVLRFLAGCHEDEMLIFMKMAFRFFEQYIQDDLSTMVNLIQTGLNLEKVVPPRRLLSAVNLMSVVLEKFGGLMGNRLLSLILQLLTCVGATVDGIFKERDNIHIGYLSTLRSLRTTCLEVLTQFFDRFGAYPWTSSEIDIILQVFVMPIVNNLPAEGVHSPTALMKLFLVWSQHPRYFILFGSHDTKSLECNPLSAIMKLLLGTKTHHSVTNVIMEMLENLYTFKDHGKVDANDMEVDNEIYFEEHAPPIPVTHVLSLNEIEVKSLNLPQEVNLGSKLLFPHISSILERFRIRLAASAKRGSGLNKRELHVLSCVSEFVRTPESSATLTGLLVPILTRRIIAPHDDEEIILKMMSTLNYLIKNVHDPTTYTRPIASLFSCINGIAGRKMLISLIKTIAETRASLDGSVREEMDQMAKISSDLNAFDKRWVEQPDFDTRLEAFKTVQTLLESGKLSVDLGVIVIHHCFYVIREEKDMSLRDFAAHCLRRVAPTLSNQHSNDDATCKFILDTTTLTLISNNIRRNNNENAHSEAVLLLGELARECSNLHPVLRDLNHLTNKGDLEVDFFENLQHLQFHRKTRALLKICDVFEKIEKVPSSRTLTQFILPLASQFLCNEKHIGKNTLIDAGIKVMGVVAHLLPWHPYELLLRYYLGKLRGSSTYQKQLVRIVMNILDAFHFDLSKAPLAVSAKKQRSDTVKSNDVEKTNILEANNKDEEGKLTTDIGETEVKPFEDLVEALEHDKEDEAEIDSEGVNDGEEAMDVDDSQPAQPVPAIERQVVLSPSAAFRVTVTIRAGLLPLLQSELTARTLAESVHKVNKKQLRNTQEDRDAEEEEILRVPMAFAVVKLLQRLPKDMLVKNLPGVFMKLCSFLKSRLESVRRVTRETMQKVMLSLGPSFLSTLLKEMTALLTRGYQVHVLVFSIHSVLIALKKVLGPGDIDSSLPYIIEVCKYDLFGYGAEEKEEGKVAVKLREAQSNKSYNTLQVVAQYVSENHLTNLLIPFKQIIQTAHSHKIVNRASECLRLIGTGLSENALIPPSSILLFAVGVASESIPALVLKQSTAPLTPKQKEKAARLQRPDCYIIKEAPKLRSGITSSDAARVAARMNAHLFVEFGLRLIVFLLKHEKLKGSVEDLRPLVDPLIPLLKDCLSSQHVKLSIISLQCFSWLFRMDLPSLRSNISTIAALIFGLLHKFAAAGMGKGDNFDLVVAAFKAVAVLVRDVKYHVLNQDQLKALLLYAEQDIADPHKHATAFALLKAILSRKLIAPEIHDVMNRVATLSITSELDHVRAQARSVFHQFLLDYPLGKKLEKHLSFYLSQLNYELQPGRESALEMVNSVICTFPVGVLAAQSGLFFLMLGARLVNDDAPDCRKMVAQCISKMLDRLSQNDRDRLFNIASTWLQDKKLSHRRLAAQLCGIFVVCEKENFQRRLPTVLPEAVAQFQFNSNESTNIPGQFVRAPSKKASVQDKIHNESHEKSNGDETQSTSESEKLKDHHVYQSLQFILKICNHCPVFLTNSEFSNHVYSLTEHAQSLLAHPHEWVRLSAAQILTHILGTLNIESLANAVKKENKADEEVVSDELGFFSVETTQKLKSMILDHCAQLTPGNQVAQELLLQIVKNLVIFADVLKDINEADSATEESADVRGNQKPISLQWLVKRMRKVVNMEVVQAPASTVLRTMVLNWTAAVVVKLGAARIKPVVHHLLAPIVREVSSEEPAPEGSDVAQLRILAKQVSGLVKKTVGSELFFQTQSRLQSQIATVRSERKMKRKHEAVAEPEKAAKRKIQKQVRKKEQKKIRKEKIRGKKFKGKKEVSLE